MLTKDIGLNKDNLIVVELPDKIKQQFETYKTQLNSISGIESVTGASGNPVRYFRSTSSAQWEGQEPNVPYEVNVITTHDDFIQNMGIKIVEGRGFDQGTYQSDTMNFMINQAAAQMMGFEEPVGKSMSVWGIKGRIVGMVQDYHMSGFQNAIPPLILMHVPQDVQVALIRFSGNANEVVSSIEEVTKSMSPKIPFEYEFVDRTYADMYETEATLGKLSGIFVVVSIIISLLGLLGLTGFTLERKSKEIGIRRVHGASITQVLKLLVGEYAWLILLAFVIAIPLSVYYMNSWLEQFVYRIDAHPLWFAFSGIVMIIICLSAIFAKSLNTIRKNPV
jgi:hypothetical protein